MMLDAILSKPSDEAREVVALAHAVRALMDSADDGDCDAATTLATLLHKRAEALQGRLEKDEAARVSK